MSLNPSSSHLHLRTASMAGQDASLTEKSELKVCWANREDRGFLRHQEFEQRGRIRQLHHDRPSSEVAFNLFTSTAPEPSSLNYI